MDEPLILFGIFLVYTAMIGVTAGLRSWRRRRESRHSDAEWEFFAAGFWIIFLPMTLVETITWELTFFGTGRHQRKLELEEAKQETIRLEIWRDKVVAEREKKDDLTV